MHKIYYTIVDNLTNEEKRVNIDINPWNTVISFPHASLDSQQLAELGHLFLAIAGDDYDHESVDELLAGYFE